MPLANSQLVTVLLPIAYRHGKLAYAEVTAKKNVIPLQTGG
jgi:hypothetical protein